MKHRRSWLLAVCALLPLQAHAARVVTLGDIALGTDDNISAARDGAQRLTEQSLQLGIGTALSEVVAEGLSLRLLARLEGQLHARYQGLNALHAGGDAQLLLRPGRHFFTPTLGASLGMGISRFSSALRDGQESRVRLFAREALTTQLAARAALFALWRGSESRAFDTHSKGAELALDWQATAPLLLTLGYQYRAGTVTSIGRPGPLAQANARALQPDDVFAGSTAFSFDAQTHLGLAAASYALGPALSWDAQLRYVESDTDFNSRYHRWMATTGLVARF